MFKSHFRKFKIGFALLLSLTSISSLAQLSSLIHDMPNNSNYMTLRQKEMNFVDSIQRTLKGADSLEFYSGCGEFKAMKKFTQQWDTRLYPSGSFEDYFGALRTFYDSSLSNYDYITEESWRELGPNKPSIAGDKGVGPVEFITIYDDGTPQSTRYMLTGSLLGGLFYSEDYGETWNSTGTDTYWAQSGVSSAVYDPLDHTKWYAASSGNDLSGSSSWVGLTGGVYRTDDNGSSWVQIADHTDLAGRYTVIYKLVIVPKSNQNDPTVLFAATSHGIYRTNNADVENPIWAQVYDSFAYDLEIKPDNSQYLYATGKSGNYWKVLESNNSGLSFTAMSTQPIQLGFPTKFDAQMGMLRNIHLTIEVTKARKNYLYCHSRDTISDDDNKRFYTKDISNPNSSWAEFASYSDKSTFGWGHGFGVEQKSNGLEVLSSMGTKMARIDLINGSVTEVDPVHVDLEDFVYHPYNIGEVWSATHGGVEKRAHYTQPWVAKYEGLGVAQVQKFTNSYTDPKYIIAGLYHDGSQITRSEYSAVNWDPTGLMLRVVMVNNHLLITKNQIICGAPHNKVPGIFRQITC